MARESRRDTDSAEHAERRRQRNAYSSHARRAHQPRRQRGARSVPLPARHPQQPSTTEEPLRARPNERTASRGARQRGSPVAVPRGPQIESTAMVPHCGTDGPTPAKCPAAPCCRHPKSTRTPDTVAVTAAAPGCGRLWHSLGRPPDDTCAAAALKLGPPARHPNRDGSSATLPLSAAGWRAVPTSRLPPTGLRRHGGGNSPE